MDIIDNELAILKNKPTKDIDYDLKPFYRYHNRNFKFDTKKNRWEHVPDFKIDK